MVILDMCKRQPKFMSALTIIPWMCSHNDMPPACQLFEQLKDAAKRKRDSSATDTNTEKSVRACLVWYQCTYQQQT